MHVLCICIAVHRSALTRTHVHTHTHTHTQPSASLTDDHSTQSRLSYVSACSEHPCTSSGGPRYPFLPRAQQPPGSSYTDLGSNFNPLLSIDSSTVSESLSSQQSSKLSSPSKNLSWVKVHRRSRSCDASKSLERDQLSLSMEKSRHHSLKRKSSPSNELQHPNGNYSMSQPAPSSMRHSTSSYTKVELKGSHSGLELSSDSMVRVNCTSPTCTCTLYM